MPCPPPGDLPNPGMETRSPVLQVDSLPSELPGKPLEGFIIRSFLDVKKKGGANLPNVEPQVVSQRREGDQTSQSSSFQLREPLIHILFLRTGRVWFCFQDGGEHCPLTWWGGAGEESLQERGRGSRVGRVVRPTARTSWLRTSGCFSSRPAWILSIFINPQN